MPEDKLTNQERRRLEALAQAIAYCSGYPQKKTPEEVIEVADRFENYIYDGTIPED